MHYFGCSNHKPTAQKHHHRPTSLLLTVKQQMYDYNYCHLWRCFQKPNPSQRSSHMYMLSCIHKHHTNTTTLLSGLKTTVKHKYIANFSLTKTEDKKNIKSQDRCNMQSSSATQILKHNLIVIVLPLPSHFSLIWQ